MPPQKLPQIQKSDTRRIRKDKRLGPSRNDASGGGGAPGEPRRRLRGSTCQVSPQDKYEVKASGTAGSSGSHTGSGGVPIQRTLGAASLLGRIRLGQSTAAGDHTSCRLQLCRPPFMSVSLPPGKLSSRV